MSSQVEPIKRTTVGKSLQINLDPKIYGTFAEIGAGQEVARYFFLAGKASQTIAKTISAYDMKFSDEIYGRERSGRYVVESRLKKMLDHEYQLLQDRLGSTRGSETCFFAFANTVATGDTDKRYCHGWMGVRFQTRPMGPSNDIILHVRMLDKHRLTQQETLGTLGVNLVHACFFHRTDENSFLNHLVENIKEDQLAIDMIRMQGEDLQALHPNTLNLALLRQGYAEGVLFGPTGDLLNASDTLYGKSLLVQRGEFQKVISIQDHLFELGKAQLLKDFGTKQDVIPLCEMSYRPATALGHVEDQDFTERIRTLNQKGYHVLVSQLYLFFELKQYLRQYTQKPLAMLTNASHLSTLFKNETYKSLEGGVLEGLGKLFDPMTRLYIYPHKTETMCTTAKTFSPGKEHQLIYDYSLQHSWIKDMAGCDDVQIQDESV